MFCGYGNGFIAHFQGVKKKNSFERNYDILPGHILYFPVAQLVEHGASNAKIMGSIPRESKS